MNDQHHTPGETSEPSAQHNSSNDHGFKAHSVGIVFLLCLAAYCYSTPNYGRFAVVLSLCVLLHELGHYAAGRAFGCLVSRVSLFFLPALSYKSRLCDTEWVLGALPLGGYTMFQNATEAPAGASHDSPFINHKPAWQRLLIHSGGLLANLLTFAVCHALVVAVGEHLWLRAVANTSLALVVLNVLPIYPLDGSAMLVTLYELVVGKTPPEGFMTVFRIAGGVLFIYLFFINQDALSSLLHAIMP